MIDRPQAPKRPLRWSLEGRLTLLALVLVSASAGLAVGVSALLGHRGSAIAVTLAIVTPLTVLASRAFMTPINRTLRALIDAVAGLRDGDFSVSLVDQRGDELGDLARAYNGVGDVLRTERQNLFQRELLLDTVIQASPQAIVLTDGSDRVLYSNTAARRLFNKGRRLEGAIFDNVLVSLPASLREAAGSGRDGLYTVEAEGEPDIFHVSHSQFTINAREHRLHQFRQLTRELTRQELATWKKVIRVISHELNNSLAPISSLAHSGRLVAARLKTDPDMPQRLDDIFSTIEDRSARLKAFLDDYARFAKLPKPRPEWIDWQGFLARLQHTLEFRLLGPPPLRPGWFDPAQIQQVLINLLKNAREAGGAPEAVELEVTDLGSEILLRILDRGPGMSESVLSSALLPFYSTKSEGTGLGLTLCREIVEAHGGRVSLANRSSGGLEVRIWLPQADALASADP